jgi:hypothetical protein
MLSILIFDLTLGISGWKDDSEEYGIVRVRFTQTK